MATVVEIDLSPSYGVMTSDHHILRAIPVTPPASGAVDASESWAKVGPVRLGELRKVVKLQKRAFRPPLAYGFSTLLVLWALPHVKFLVARDGERIVGCAIGDRQGGQSRVITICVDPTARRQGIGRLLLRALETALPKGSMVLMVEEGNTAAESLYRSEGYNAVGNSRDYYGRGLHGIWMQKQRGPVRSSKIWI
jgi:ribosomal protein S18 acetylase RimI-like enzyme